MSKKIGHLKVAVCSKNLTHVDSAFSFSRQVVFYDVSYDSIEFIDVARFASPPRRSEAAAAMASRCCFCILVGSGMD